MQPGPCPGSLVLGTGPPPACKPAASWACPRHFCFPSNHMEGRGPDRYWGWCRHHFQRGHVLMCLAVTHSVTGPPHLTVSPWAPQSVPLSDSQSHPCQGHLSPCMPGHKCLRRAKCGHSTPVAAEERQRAPAQTQAGLSVLRRCRLSESGGPLQPWPLRFRQEETEEQTAPSPAGPFTSTSTFTGTHPPLQWDLTLHWNPDNTHAGLTSRCGAVGTPREEVPSTRAEKELGLDSAAVGRSGKAGCPSSCLTLSAADAALLWAGWARPAQIRPPLPVLHLVTRSSGSGS